MKARTELPDDPALPGLAAIRAVGVAGALPATRLAEFAARPAPVARVEAPVLRLNGAALELILGALSTRPATPEELEQIRKLLSEGHDRAP